MRTPHMRERLRLGHADAARWTRRSVLNTLVIASMLACASRASAQGLPRNWVNVGGGTTGSVKALAVNETGGGHVLYAGGELTAAGGVQLSMVAQWNGLAWAPLSTPLGDICCGSYPVSALNILDLDDGAGPGLYAGGSFLGIPGPNQDVHANYLMRWDGAAIAALPELYGNVNAITTFDFDDGNGEVLVVAGGNLIPGQTNVARWTGTAWVGVGTNLIITSPVKSLAVHGGKLYAGGTALVQESGSVPPMHLVCLDTDSDTFVAPPDGLRPWSTVTAMTLYNGDLLVASGNFQLNGNFMETSLVSYDGSAWSSIGLQSTDNVSALVEGGDGALYAGGNFNSLVPCCPKVARFDGAAWIGLGPDSDPDGDINAIATAGQDDCLIVYVGGGFEHGVAKYTPEPMITAQPQGLARCVGQPAFFSVQTLGGALTFQWKRNGAPIAGANGPAFAIPAVAAADAGIYSVTVSNACGEVDSVPVVLDVRVPVTITTQPTDKTACVGELVAFNVIVDGTPPLTYQWFKNGVPIPGANANAYALFPVQLANAGAYQVVIGNACGTVTSNVATLTVKIPVQITQQPVTQIACEGQPATFTVAANGSNLTYQWLKNGVEIPGANLATYTIPAVTPDDEALYSVRVSNVCNTVQSFTAPLVVLNCPPPCVCKGDMNASGWIDGLDIRQFIDALMTPPPPNSCADMNGDGSVTPADTPLFVNRLLNPTCP